METKRVLISGASIAGPALAFWLNRYGYKVTVIERARAIRPGGYAVDFRGVAMQVLERMGIVDEIRKMETRAGKITIVNKHNKKDSQHARRLYQRRAGDPARRPGQYPVQRY